MSSIARHHAEWLSLLEISGPFLSMPVLLDALPQGLDAHDAELAQELRAAYEEWADNQGGLQPDPAIHTAWVRYVLETTLDLEGALAEGQVIPEGIKAVIPEHGEVIRPDMMVLPPGGETPRMLIRVHSHDQDLEKALPSRPWQASAATRMMELLYATKVRLGSFVRGTRACGRKNRSPCALSRRCWASGASLACPTSVRWKRSSNGARRISKRSPISWAPRCGARSRS